MTHGFKVALLSAAALVAAGVTMHVASADGSDKSPSYERSLAMTVNRARLLNCFEGSVERFDDRLSPANVVASAVAWHCEAEGKAENYWIVLSQRRSTPDTVDAFYRDLALPFVLEARARRVRQNS